MYVVERLKEFMPSVIEGERMGLVFNMAYGIQREINRKLYLNETYFDPERLRVDQGIVREL